MDEVGRGTSTFDGLSLAWASAEHLAKLGSLTLFATHYFEMTELPELFEHTSNVHLTATEHDDHIIFMHSVQNGPANKSYGLQVGQLAGVPPAVIQSAKDKLNELEANKVSISQTSVSQVESNDQQVAEMTLTQDEHTGAKLPDIENPVQADMFLSPVNDKVLTLLEKISPDDLTPRQALEAIYTLKDAIKS
jgi:DNA mismatch repair protein MutS